MMRMLQVCYALIQIAEMLLDIRILYSLCPKPEKRNGWLWSAGSIISYTILCIIYVFNGLDSFISNISILIFGLQFSAVYCIFCKAKFLKAFLAEVLYLINLSFLKLPVLILECMALGEPLYKVNRGGRTKAECFWSAVLICIIVLAAKKKAISEYYRKSIQLLVSEEAGLLLVIAGFQWFLLSYGMWVGKMGFHTLDFVFSIILIFGIFLCLHYLLLRIAYHELQLEKGRLDISQGLLQEQNEELREIYQKNSLRLHEYYRTLSYLYYCITEGKHEEAKDFLSRHLDEVKEEKREIWTGLPFLDFILNYKKQAMDKKDIVFRLELDVYEYPFEEAELGILLGNLLDNAIEACEKCVPGKREIYLRIWNVRYMFMLKLTNSSSKSPELKGKRFITDKADQNAHGMGVEQVRRIVVKYGGDISFQYSGEHFETKVMVSTMVSAMKEEQNGT